MKWFAPVLLLLLSTASYGQFKWDFGLQASINNAMLAGQARDTFSPKASVGGNMFTERNFNSFALRSTLGYKQNRYSNDILNRTTVTHAFELGMQYVQALDSARHTFLTFGLVGAYAGGHYDILVTGEQLDALNQRLVDEPFHVGAQLGLELRLKAGRRLTVDYAHYLNSQQTSTTITGRMGHLSLGLQYRIREYSNSKDNMDLFDSIRRANEVASFHKQQITDQANGLMVFVLPSKPRDYYSLTKTQDEIDQEFAVSLEQMITTIHSTYASGNYLITLDTMMTEQSPATVFHIDENHQAVEVDVTTKSVYYGFLEQGFIDLNGAPKWGLFVYDGAMNRLKTPFPFFTPYRALDTEFKSIQNMIRAFDAQLGEVN